MRRLLLAWQFLTILPVALKGEVTDADLSRSAGAFPLAGALLGAMLAGLALLFLLVFPAPVAAGLTLAAAVISIGGFHLDGLADTFDALAVKSTGHLQTDREKRLAVMKDSATGAIGVLSITVAMLLKYLLLAELFATAAVTSLAGLLIMMSALAKWALTAAMFHGRPARPDGLGRIFLSAARGKNFRVATGYLLILGAGIFLGLLRTPHGAGAALFFLLAAGLLYLVTLGLTAFFTEKFGGITGDNFGAVHEISELLFLLLGIIWLRHFT